MWMPSYMAREATPTAAPTRTTAPAAARRNERLLFREIPVEVDGETSGASSSFSGVVAAAAAERCGALLSEVPQDVSVSIIVWSGSLCLSYIIFCFAFALPLLCLWKEWGGAIMKGTVERQRAQSVAKDD